MRIHNFLPVLVDCLKRWESAPDRRTFLKEYFDAISGGLGGVFDGPYLHSVIRDLDWEMYRAETLDIDPAKEETRLRGAIRKVEELFGFQLEGDAVLFGAFTCMDGYARFDGGTHRVFLGVDESHGRGTYLDILITHELTHVVRESRETVWTGLGLDPKMTNSQFTDSQPVIEHLAGEGFSCVVSEILNPGEDAWHYCYQTEQSLDHVIEHSPALERGIRNELEKPDVDGDYSRLYSPRLYGVAMPAFAHYVWAWQWARHVLETRFGGDVRAMAGATSRDWTDSALDFRLARSPIAMQRKKR